MFVLTQVLERFQGLFKTRFEVVVSIIKVCILLNTTHTDCISMNLVACVELTDACGVLLAVVNVKKQVLRLVCNIYVRKNTRTSRMCVQSKSQSDHLKPLKFFMDEGFNLLK